jgi:hypothetical protein
MQEKKSRLKGKLDSDRTGRFSKATLTDSSVVTVLDDASVSRSVFHQWAGVCTQLILTVTQANNEVVSPLHYLLM